MPVTGYMSTEAGLQGGSLSPALSGWVETLRGTASLVIPSELPAAVVGVTRRGGPGPPLGLGARWVSESNLRGPQWLASCGRLSASPSEEWPTRSGPAFTCRRLGHFGLPRVGPSYLLEGNGPDQEEVAADAVH